MFASKPYFHIAKCFVPLGIALINVPIFGAESLFSLFGFMVCIFCIGFFFVINGNNFSYTEGINEQTLMLAALVLFIGIHAFFIHANALYVLFWMAILLFFIILQAPPPKKLM